MAANSVALARPEVRAALLTHTQRPHKSNLHHHWEALGDYFNARLISVGHVLRVCFSVNVIIWVMVTMPMDVISSDVNIQTGGVEPLWMQSCLGLKGVHNKLFHKSLLWLMRK